MINLNVGIFQRVMFLIIEGGEPALQGVARNAFYHRPIWHLRGRGAPWPPKMRWVGSTSNGNISETKRARRVPLVTKKPQF